MSGSTETGRVEPEVSSIRIPLFKPYFPPESRRAILDDLDQVLASGRLMNGPFQARLEESFGRAVGAPHAVSVNSCTTALTVCLRYFGADGADVLVPSGSFVTSVSSILFAGGRPILVDMNPATLSFDLADLERKLTPRTKGLVWVHLTGVISPEYAEVIRFAGDHGLFVIEDCAHALGASIDGRPAGSLGDAGCYSFYPTKIITSGTGGMITGADADLAAFAREMRMFGKRAEDGEIVRLGNDWFLDEIRCCVAFHQLEGLATNLAARRAVAADYYRGLGDVPGLTMLDHPSGAQPSFYQFPVFLAGGEERDRVRDELKQTHGIETKGIYKPTHREIVLQKYDDGRLARTEQTLDRSLCLPIYPDLTAEQVGEVIGRLRQVMDGAR